MKTKRLFALFIATLALLAFTSVSLAADFSPVGTWKTIDDKTNKTRSIIKIWKTANGTFNGRIIKVYKQPGDKKTCVKCPGRFKNKKIAGLTIMWGLKQESKSKWGGGRILDPKTGDIYRCYIKLQPNNKRLKIRGYIGISMLGRTQTWIRVR